MRDGKKSKTPVNIIGYAALTIGIAAFFLNLYQLIVNYDAVIEADAFKTSIMIIISGLVLAVVGAGFLKGKEIFRKSMIVIICLVMLYIVYSLIQFYPSEAPFQAEMLVIILINALIISFLYLLIKYLMKDHVRKYFR